MFSLLNLKVWELLPSISDFKRSIFSHLPDTDTCEQLCFQRVFLGWFKFINNQSSSTGDTPCFYFFPCLNSVCPNHQNDLLCLAGRTHESLRVWRLKTSIRAREKTESVQGKCILPKWDCKWTLVPDGKVQSVFFVAAYSHLVPPKTCSNVSR